MLTAKKIISLFVFIFVLMIIINSCATYKGADSSMAPVHDLRGDYKYRYFPSSKVYFDVQKGVYFYRTDNLWTKSYELPPTIHLNRLKDYVILILTKEIEKPNEFHEDIIKKYPHDFFNKGKGKKYYNKV
jgi:hypothetical protein